MYPEFRVLTDAVRTPEFGPPGPARSAARPSYTEKSSESAKQIDMAGKQGAQPGELCAFCGETMNPGFQVCGDCGAVRELSYWASCLRLSRIWSQPRSLMAWWVSLSPVVRHDGCWPQENQLQKTNAIATLCRPQYAIAVSTPLSTGMALQTRSLHQTRGHRVDADPEGP